MDAKTFKDKYGIGECRRVAELAGTNYDYFYQIATRFRRPSVEKAQALVEASDGRLDLLSLLVPDKDAA